MVAYVPPTIVGMSTQTGGMVGIVPPAVYSPAVFTHTLPEVSSTLIAAQSCCPLTFANGTA